jgi:hypothetical protein
MTTKQQRDVDDGELITLQRLRQEAAQDREAAQRLRDEAAYDRGQIEWSLREKQSLEKIITARELKLREMNEAALLARARALDERERSIAEREGLWNQAKYQALREMARPS